MDGFDRFRAPPPDMLVMRPLDSMVAIFHRPSGRTHVVASPVPEILESLGPDPTDVATLLARLSERFDLAAGDREALLARLGELEAAGLVERL
ncbi:HPr-rel-A system PqqD family peptide chaperone [Stakelama saccharophila]|uniref:HPr-rel-A system PqqD family peptide chaperone n=1 Tax=Stakelama saccharophila TaxID=3075605 RepID=A0ABZ0B6N6_9SPHN|nr:HPr-rel-A system PqqD family peptide chaperone [Stakelama sp. W311]WNO53038.1 HPr-rel-A system PqqD family peptide chaperone [Stakelama sp. W311]